MSSFHDAHLQVRTRDSLELASLASSDHADTLDSDSRPSISSSRKLSLEQDDPLDAGNVAAGGRPRGHSRTFSMSSGFDFTANMFPLSSTAGAGYTPIGAPTVTATQNGGLGGQSLEKHKTLTYMNGLSLIVGLIIGSGIFSSPSQVNVNVGSPGAALIVWVIAGVLAWTGAASYAELGGAIPLNGGAQVYLAKIFHEIWGFLFMWSAVLVLKPGSSAIISIIMGEYLVRAAIGAEAETINPWYNKVVGLAGLFLVTFLNCVSTKLGTRVNDLLMFMKFIALIGVTITGVVVAITGYSYTGQPNLDWKTHEWFEGTKMDASAWALALYAGLWAYDGWDNVSTNQIRLHLFQLADKHDDLYRPTTSWENFAIRAVTCLASSTPPCHWSSCVMYWPTLPTFWCCPWRPPTHQIPSRSCSAPKCLGPSGLYF